MNELIDKKVIVRCTNAGVFFGTLKSIDWATRVAHLTECRRVWYWSGAASLSEMAAKGVANPKACKFPAPVDIVVAEVIEVLPCTDEAVESLTSVPVWSAR